ncbi:MAG: response regulator [Deltaproteobacteria bacterium]|nr:response regulator [Deltaproteobacteria bacterium]
MESIVQNPGKQRKVLIVEDNEMNLKLFRLIIGSLGYEVFSARNGEEGVRMAKEIVPDLILMDIQMPVMDGITAMDNIKATEGIKDIPVIALTSYAMKGDRERLLQHGFVDYIAKPVRKDSLIMAAKKVLEKGD